MLVHELDALFWAGVHLLADEWELVGERHVNFPKRVLHQIAQFR